MASHSSDFLAGLLCVARSFCHCILFHSSHCMDSRLTRSFGLLGLCTMTIAYIGIVSIKRLELPLPDLISSYMADLLCMPLLLSATLFLLRRIKHSPQFYLGIGHIVFILCYVSFAFEYVLPRYHPSYTSDLLDVCCYGLGAISFVFMQKRVFNGLQKAEACA